MLESFPPHFKSERQKFSSTFDELKLYQFKKCPIYSIDVMQYALFLQYKSLQS